jgi:predicted nucleic acid-binding protein
MEFILDASAALAWFVQRSDPHEAALADEILSRVERNEARVPGIWYTEVANGLLVAERSRLATPSESSRFLSELAALPIEEERVQQSSIQAEVLALGRRYGLTACDAIYVELSLRTGLALATFDAQLADALRKAGGRVFGDAA